MVDEELLIHELAARAGISIRTIRYYIEEGLLPQPNYQGKYSTYSREFLDRLELILRLKESYLPLKEIREIMNSLSDEQVRLKLKEPPPPRVKFSGQPAPAQPAGKPGEKALNYINRLMDDQTRYKTRGFLENKQDINLSKRELPVEYLQSPGNRFAQYDEENWLRITFAEGVELHLRRPLEPEVEFRVRQLISYAQKIFNT
jgi:DNA-binding transcriptional MerR regulator